MIKSTVLIVMFSILFLNNSYSQDKDTLNMIKKENSREGITLYINNPFGIIFNHVRLKAAYKTSTKHSYILSFTQYYKIFPSSQVYTEYQYNLLKSNKAEFLIYAKTGVGDYSYREKMGIFSGFDFENPNNYGYYYFIGAGIVHEYYLGKSKRFSLQFSEGLKISRPFNYKTSSIIGNNPDGLGWAGFLLWGPGAILDLNINFGYKF